ncbi:MAG: hypothetical protein JWO57_3285 [Pseudonocardiales bacterium]|nr:hypothetical protein [Pseudonocardiales bacterium]
MTAIETRTVVAILDRTAEDRVAHTARRLYEAEVALHTARQSHADRWVAAAYDRLHEAVVAHRLAVALSD